MSSSWICPSCTLINEAEDVRCDACDAPQPIATRSKSGSSIAPSKIPNGKHRKTTIIESSQSSADDDSLLATEKSSDDDIPVGILAAKGVRTSNTGSKRLRARGGEESANGRKTAKKPRKQPISFSSSEGSGSDTDFAEEFAPGRRALAIERGPPPPAKPIQSGTNRRGGERRQQSTLDSLPVLKGPPPPPKVMSVPSPERSISAASGSSTKAQSAPLSKAEEPTSSDLWLDQCAPQKRGDLLLDPKKIVEMVSWLETARMRMKAKLHPGVLILLGPSGVGKSTAAHVLCKELEWTVRSWQDVGSRGGMYGNGGFQPDSGDFDVRTILAQPLRDADGDLRLAYTSVLDDFREYMLQGRLFPALQLTGDAPAAPIARPNEAILIVEDLPRPLSSDYAVQNRFFSQLSEIFSDFLAQSAFPAIVVVSEGVEPGDSPTQPALVRLLGAHVVNHENTKILNFLEVPPGRMTKKLQAVAAQHHATIPTSVISGIVESSHGDLRHALMTLQMISSAPVAEHRQSGEKRQKMRDIHADEGSVPMDRTVSFALCGRDDFLDSLRILSKMLYAKKDASGKLENPPDTLAAVCPYDAATTALFLQESGPHFFSDLDDYGRFVDVLGTADISARNSTNLGEEVIGSLVVRAASAHNLHPMPFTFRQLRKPPLFAVQKAKKANTEWLSLQDLGNVSAFTSSGEYELNELFRVNARERAIHVVPTLGLILRGSGVNFTNLLKSGKMAVPSPAAAALCLAATTFNQYTGVLPSGELICRIGQPISKLRDQRLTPNDEDQHDWDGNRLPSSTSGSIGEWAAMAANHGVNVVALMNSGSGAGTTSTKENRGAPGSRTAFATTQSAAVLLDDDIRDF